MSLHSLSSRQLLRTASLQPLFIDELGWDRHVAQLDVEVAYEHYQLRAIAVKRGVVAYQCSPDTHGNIPPSPIRRAIDHAVTRTVREHIIVYTNHERSEQIWQWVRRDVGQSAVPQEYHYHHKQSGDLLLQRLQSIAFTLDEEASLTLTDVNQRVRAAFDVDRITKRFYEGYRVEHQAFYETISGIPDAAMQRWYTSVMLNRLMFTYFIQQKAFLDGDTAYLRNRLKRSLRVGNNRFYQDFLCPLFFHGLGQPREQRPTATQALLGNVPYLNGGLFLEHRIEKIHGKTITIPDQAFVGPLDFFDHYRWHLDDRPLRNDGEINPEVLGYIFEKYINQKQMGAYYTKEDITGYIARSSIIPHVLDRVAEQQSPVSNASKAIVARLQASPERYIYADAQHGADLPLPVSIAAGQQQTEQRRLWNAPAPANYALPSEIWREVVARRHRYTAIQNQIAGGRLNNANDLVTANLDVATLTQDLIAAVDDPSELLAFWHAVEAVTILDPTSGSGAFLFASLNVLQPLYEACLDRMAVLLSDRQGYTGMEEQHALTTFKDVLARIEAHPNRPYFILKSIIVNNLYGVDIMEEAVEICKLRLFLKLAALIERDPTRPNMGAEPLPDVDFNIFAGNALVGYATYDEIRDSITATVSGQTRLQFNSTIDRIDERIRAVDTQFQQFRQQQLGVQHHVSASEKHNLQQALDQLDSELDRFLAAEYDVDTTQPVALKRWRESHQPFHWFVKFYRVLQQNGGFDVVIGNPPYVGYNKVRSLYSVRNYRTESCANLYAFAVERSLALLRKHGRYGMIVPIASVSTDGMSDLQELYAPYRQWHSHWAVRPGKLFVGVDMNLTITLLQKTHDEHCSYTTGYRRWSNGADSDRPQLFTTLTYVQNPRYAAHSNPYPKLGSQLEMELLGHMLNHGRTLRDYTSPSGTTLYYHSGGRYWRKALTTKLSSHYKPVTVPKRLAPVVFALLNSQLFYWYWISNSNCMDVVAREVLDLPVFPLERANATQFDELMQRLLTAYYANSASRVRRGEFISGEEINFDVSRAKPIIDEIDLALAKCYEFSEPEEDFILNYDVKYRVGETAG